jgi:restriction system protein
LGQTDNHGHHLSRAINDAIKRMRKRKHIDATKLSLSEWLTLMKSRDREGIFFVEWQFPTKSMRDEYLGTIKSRTDDEVIDLLRNFLMISGWYGCDDYLSAIMLDEVDKGNATLENVTATEHLKNLFRSIFSRQELPSWEGNTWIIDLLPDNPQLAIYALQAYLVSHFPYLPDGKIDGMLDAITLIQAKFIDTRRNFRLFKADPRQFEQLVSTLYRRMGYKTELTKPTHDGGRDVIAERLQSGEKERSLIQCKRTGKNVGVGQVRSLLGVVSNERATKGVFVCTSRFTPAAKKLADENRRLELIDHEDLQMLLNAHFGTAWSKYVLEIVLERIAETKSRNARAKD